jgi:hypothetical protein
MDANMRAREILEQAEKNARGVEDQLWAKVPNKNASVEAGGFLDALATAKGRLLPTEELPSPIRGLDKAFEKEPPTVESLLKARSRLLALARDARAGATPDRTAAGIYDSLANAALDDVAGAVGEAGQQARAFSRAINDRFSRSFAGEVLGTSATGGARIAPELTLERAMGGGGPQGELRMRELEQAAAPIDFGSIVGAGRTRDLSPQMRIVQEQFLRANAEKLINPNTGQIAPGRVETFLRDNRDLMQRFPGLGDDLRAAGEASRDVAAATAEVRKIQASAQELERTVTSKIQKQIDALAKITNTEDPVRLVDSALRGPTPSADVAALARVAQRGGPEAVAGLRGAMLDSVMGVEGAKDFEQIRKTLFEPLSRDRPALVQVMRENGLLTATQQANLKRIIEKGAQLQRVAQSGRRIDDLTGPSDALFDFALRSAGAKAGASGIMGQASGSSLVAASAGSKYFRKILDATPRTRTQEIFKEMLENPKLLDDMLFKAQSKKQQRQRFQSINAALVQAGIMAPIDFSKED